MASALAKSIMLGRSTRSVEGLLSDDVDDRRGSRIRSREIRKPPLNDVDFRSLLNVFYGRCDVVALGRCGR